MMIAIKNIKMPLNCEECFARMWAWCLLDEEERTVIPALPDELPEGRPDWCPMVEVPDMNVGKCSEIPNSLDGEYDPRPDIYYLAEKIGIHRLYALVVQLRGEPESCIDTISRRAAIDETRKCRFVVDAIEKIRGLPSVQPEIIRCKDCRYSDYDQIFHNRYCHNKGKADLVGDDFFCAAGRYMTNGSD